MRFSVGKKKPGYTLNPANTRNSVLDNRFYRFVFIALRCNDRLCKPTPRFVFTRWVFPR
jgi:hypothetical protein